LLLGVATAAAIGGMGTIIANVTNATVVGLLEKEGVRISFLTGCFMAYLSAL
jgi:sodium-dependent dicarboxylate transporter 2/3/5